MRDNLAMASFVFFAMAVYALYIAWRNKQTALKAFKQIEEITECIRSTRLAGIYVIINTTTGAQYLGSTKKNFMARWGQHVGALSVGEHGNARLQEDWNTCGPDAFQFGIVTSTDDPAVIEALPEIERSMLLERAQTIPPILNYNIAHSRVYGVPSAPDAEPIVPVFQSPKSQRMHRPRRQKIHTVTDPNGYSLSDLGLSPEEIAALGLLSSED